MLKATRQQTKEHNINLALKIVYEQGPVSRADIARVTGLTRTTVSDIVSDLIAGGLLEETGTGSPVSQAAGKPPILLNLCENSRLLACIDLSGNEFRGALVNLRGKIVKRVSVDATGMQDERAVKASYTLLDALINSSRERIIGIGIGTPGLVDSEHGVILDAVRLHWNNLPFREMVEARYGLPVHMINDSQAAALAEHTFGDYRQEQNLVVVKIGEGIGAGILLSGRLHSGDGFGAGEIGHLTVVEGGRQCTCGNYGCLETIASTRAILQRMRELAEYGWISFSSVYASYPAEINWDFVRQAFKEGDETVTGLVSEAGRYLGLSIANLIAALSIRTIVITGSYVDFGDTFLEAVRAEVKKKSLRFLANETRIFNSRLGQANVILGASALVLAQEMGLP